MPAPVIGLFFKGIVKGIAVGAKATAKTAVKTSKKIKTTSIKINKQKIKTNRFLNQDKLYERRKEKRARLSDKNIFSNILANPFNIVDKVKSGLFLILFGTLINSLPTILKKIDKIMKRVKAAYDAFVKILVSIKDAAQTFIQSVEENKYYQKVRDFFSSGDADKFTSELEKTDREAGELEKESKKLEKEVAKLEKQIKIASKGVDPRTGLYVMQYPDDPELKKALGVDTDRINFTAFIKEFNDETVDSMVAILGVERTIEELKAELTDPRNNSNEKKNQIRKQISRLQSEEYRRENQIINGNNEEVDLSFNGNGEDDDKIVFIKENTYIRGA
tara:strand:- start:1411 stop:2409 length:999 start_codon:yes stop_codon:yes gene_type:complete